MMLQDFTSKTKKYQEMKPEQKIRKKVISYQTEINSTCKKLHFKI